VGVQEGKWDKGDTVRTGFYNFFYGRRNENNQLGTKFLFVHHRILSAFKRVEFVSNRMSYIAPRVYWCNIVLNVHAPSEEKSGD